MSVENGVNKMFSFVDENTSLLELINVENCVK